jgi:8-oxo-dGTP pyrophosphatase MutT (NUDIX family)
MQDEHHYRVSVKGIEIDENGKFLLSKEDNGMWEFLGGGLAHNEDHMQCLRREIMEETGLRVTYVSSSPKFFVTAPKYGKKGYVANIIYEIKLENHDFVPSDECQELRYFSLEEMKRVKLYPQVENLRKQLEAQQK